MEYEKWEETYDKVRIGTQSFGLAKELTANLQGTIKALHDIGFNAIVPGINKICFLESVKSCRARSFICPGIPFSAACIRSESSETACGNAPQNSSESRTAAVR